MTNQHLAAVAALTILFATTARAQTTWAEVSSVGQGTAGTAGVPVLRWQGLPVTGQPSLDLVIAQGRPGAAAQLVVGTQTSPSALPAHGATLYPLPVARLDTSLDALGSSPSFTPPGSTTPPALDGLTLTLQGLVVDPRAAGGLAFTAGAEVTFGAGSVAAPLFPQPQALLPGRPVATALGDLDGDGRLDAVTALDGDTFAVQLQAPAGQLQPVAFVDAGGSQAVDIALGDLDGDGALDVVVANLLSAQGNGRVGVRRGLGDGTFAPWPDKVVGSECVAVELGDLNGDGSLDLVAARKHGVVSFVGHGDGSFGPPLATFVPATLSSASQLVLADVTDDGFLDALLAPSGTPVLLAEGSGDGSLLPPVGAMAQAPYLGKIASLAAGDVTGDGHVDVVVGMSCEEDTPDQYDGLPDSLRLAVLPGLAGGGLGAPVVTDLPLAGVSFEVYLTVVTTLAVGDWDGDAFADVIAHGVVPFIFGQSVDSLIVLRGQADGQLVEATPRRRLRAEGLSLGDVDADGLLDVAVTTGRGQLLHVLRGAGAAGFDALPELDAGPNDHIPVQLSDLDGDGHLDLVCIDHNTGLVRVDVLAGDGGSFSLAQSFPVPGQTDALPHVLLDDVDGDGLRDLLIVAAHPQGGLRVARQLPGPGLDFAAVTITAVPMPGQLSGWFDQAFAAPLDDDGVPDVLLVGHGSSYVLPCLGDGAGGFSVGAPVELDGSTRSAALGDVDGDGLLDLVSVDGTAGFRVRAGLGDGAFEPLGQWHVLPDGARWVQVVDLEAQPGRQLIFTPDPPYFGESLQVVALPGDGSFGPASSYDVPEWAQLTAVHDLDGDGALDLVLTGAESVSVLLGVGDGSFAPAQPFLTAETSRAVAGDIDEDGRADLLVGTAKGTAGPVLLPGQGGAP